MKKIKNSTGTKAVNIIKDATGTYRCMFVQIHNSLEQMLETKSYKSLKMSEEWANNKLKIKG